MGRLEIMGSAPDGQPMGFASTEQLDQCGHCNRVIQEAPLWQALGCPECAYPICWHCAELRECDPYENKIRRVRLWTLVCERVGVDPHAFFRMNSPVPPPARAPWYRRLRGAR